MLKSRRGLLAAGLAVAVVGAIGIASTLNAGAEQISGAPERTTVADTPTGDAAGDAADTATPPAVLPWGSRPTRIRRGAPGANSKTLRADGSAAAPADTSGATTARGRYAPKGGGNKSKFIKSEVTEVVPPAPPGDGSTKAIFNYDVGSQEAVATGLYANLYIAKPYLDKSDYHTLAELALQSGSADKNAQKIEVGWNVDRVVNGDDDPHLFVFHWINDEGTCYNACGFVQYSKAVKPGDTLTYGVAKKFGIEYSNGAWWIAYDTEWVGYFPVTEWSNQGVTFEQGGFFQAFGEVASTSQVPCTDMGTGKEPSSSASAYVGTFTLVNPDRTPAMFIRPDPDKDKNAQDATGPYPVYPVTSLSTANRSFRYGGGGSTATTCADYKASS